jgi:hypothetical protein
MKQFVCVLTIVALAAGTAMAQQAPPATGAGQAPSAQQAPAPPPMPASPRGTAATQVGGKWVEPTPGAAPRYQDGKWITVDYGRPILRGRTDIFGKGADYGKKVSGGDPVWRAGANQTTRLKTEVPLVVAGKTVPAGEYSVFVELKEGAWTFILSTQPYQQKYDRNDKTATWGNYNYDPKFDVVRAPMKLAPGTVSVDEFTIGFVNMTQQGGAVALWWEKTMAWVEFGVGQ